MDRLRSLEVFVSVVELGSFSSAANGFGITPAMVSRHITGLEKQLGGTLLARTTRSMKLTELGENYYKNCKHILGLLSAANLGAEALTRRPQGNLKVSASLGFGALELSPKISQYLTGYPEVNIELSLTDRYVDIIEEGFDVAIRIGELKDSSLKARRIADFELAICAAPTYLAKAGYPRTPDDLPHHECLEFASWGNKAGWQSLTKTSRQTPARAPRYTANNGHALRDAALAGIGLIMMPRALLQQDIESGALIEVMADYLPRPRPVYAVFPGEKQLAPKLSSFIDFLADSFSIRH
ncbi:transcriptional regulator, LysR family [Methylophilus rhizosphaerae]|uniref:Transcriptional regulator, LysR family n=1 Tax=Methylophilus rhizosphaerae TaxID=492660 RepID=A0A1G9CS69_9PROT|nr:LysR family transcriptional regulator [Methylophilus rhizosphaerae]SDK54264.1 transcriptional regulator, LysR family [Methylophilus rhizosphaerae]